MSISSSLLNFQTFPLQKHLITLFLFQIILCIVVALITSFFRLRSAAVICIASVIDDFHMTSDAHFDNRDWNAFCDCLVVDFAMMTIERLMIERWWMNAENLSKKRRNEVNDELKDATAEKKWSFIIDLLFFPRDVNRAWAAKNISRFHSSNSTYVSTRVAFLRRRLIFTLISFLLFDVIVNFLSSNSFMFFLFIISFFRRLDDVTSSELTLQLSNMLAFWMSIYCIINVINEILMLFCVELKVSETKNWSLIFKIMRETSLMRRFWEWLCSLSWFFFPQTDAEIANSYFTSAHFDIKSTASPSKVSFTPSLITFFIFALASSYHNTSTSLSAFSSRISSTWAAISTSTFLDGKVERCGSFWRRWRGLCLRMRWELLGMKVWVMGERSGDKMWDSSEWSAFWLGRRRYGAIRTFWGRERGWMSCSRCRLLGGWGGSHWCGCSILHFWGCDGSRSD